MPFATWALCISLLSGLIFLVTLIVLGQWDLK
jgi:hypothetical protein